MLTRQTDQVSIFSKLQKLKKHVKLYHASCLKLDSSGLSSDDSEQTIIYAEI